MTHLETLRATLNDAHDYVIDAYAAASAADADADAKKDYYDACNALHAARAAYLKFARSGFTPYA